MRRVTGAPAIYADGVRLVKLTNRQIRSIVVGHPNKTSMDYTRAVASRLKELKATGTPARLDAVVIAEQKQFDIDSLRRSTVDKVGIYKQAGLDGLVSIRALSQVRPVGFDILIIDQQHVGIAFPSIAGAEDLMTGLIFEDQPDVAREFANWFDQRVWPTGTPILDI